MSQERRPRAFIPAPWVDRAACAGTDPALWFPDTGEHATQARAICAGCPVRTDCRDYAIAAEEQGGIWGGMGRDERLEWKRRQR